MGYHRIRWYMQKETRAIATVYPQTAEARRDNYRNNTIEKALG